MGPDQISGAGGGRGVRRGSLLDYECVEEILRRISMLDGGRGDMDRWKCLSTVWCCSGGDSFLCPWQFLFIGHDNFYSQDMAILICKSSVYNFKLPPHITKFAIKNIIDFHVLVSHIW